MTRSIRSLTPREIQVLQLLARAATNHELAAALGISPRTVESHLTSIYRKLGVRSRLAAVLWARSNLPDAPDQDERLRDNSDDIANEPL